MQANADGIKNVFTRLGNAAKQSDAKIESGVATYYKNSESVSDKNSAAKQGQK